MRILCRRRKETIGNLAEELNVSPRTIERDIDILSLTEPIYTISGRYNGGVYVIDGYYIDQMYMNDAEVYTLQKVYDMVREKKFLLTPDEKYTLLSIIKKYSKPKIE